MLAYRRADESGQDESFHPERDFVSFLAFEAVS